MTLTHTAFRFHNLLEDGSPHFISEFIPLLWDEEAADKEKAVIGQMHLLRKRVRPTGHDIVFNRETKQYRMVRNIGD